MFYVLYAFGVFVMRVNVHFLHSLHFFMLSSFFSLSDCSLHKLISSQLALSQPPTNLVASDNTTLNCRVSSVTRHTTLMWTVDNVTYDTSGTFNTSRGQIVLSFSTFDSAVTCSKSSNLTILNVSMNSEGVYSCSAIDNNSTATSNVSLALSSTIQRSSSSRSKLFKFYSCIAELLYFRISVCDRRSHSRGGCLSVYFGWNINDYISLLSTF